ncbi:hypothetical protein DSL92_06900 [Billgrantia gudaonensis]|uniref:Uncharacterized protein n=1 Tax=Billgrantia gudaonensis TaxID=376427 RepID=A0A3S0QFP5_9GAMM|nr:hypothetical protein DSL92_06900 [Halomonas gudaonensis]
MINRNRFHRHGRHGCQISPIATAFQTRCPLGDGSTNSRALRYRASRLTTLFRDEHLCLQRRRHRLAIVKR